MFVGNRSILISPVASASYETLSPPLRAKVNRAIYLLGFSKSYRPEKLAVFESKNQKGKYIVKVSPTLRILYHVRSKEKVYIDLIYIRRNPKLFIRLSNGGDI